MEDLGQIKGGGISAIGALRYAQGPRSRRARHCGLSSLSRKELVSIIQDLAGRLMVETSDQDRHLAQLGLLAAGIAHEINNPNNFIMTNAQILADIWDDADRILKKRLEEKGDFTLGGFSYAAKGCIIGGIVAGIADGSARISEIVASIRNATMPASETADECADINSSVRDAAIIMNHEIRNRTDSCRLRLADNLPRVRGNRRNLARVVINLLSNALKSLPARSSGIDVSTWLEENSGMVALSVSDEGGGMSPEDIDHIFEPFFSTRQGSGGMGLGLNISLSIVEECGGAMEFRSSPGTGTTAIVRLPVVAGNAVDAPL